MKTILLTLLGVAMGLFMVLLLPFLVVYALRDLIARFTDWWQTVTGTPHVCAAGTPPLDETTRLEEVTRRDAEEMQRAIDDAERILQDAKELSDKKAQEDDQLPPVFERWWRRESDKRDPESPPWSEASEYD